MDDRKWYRVSLRFFGDALPVHEIERKLGLEPSYIGRIGDPVHDDPRAAQHKTNVWTRSLTEDTSVPFDEQIGDLLDVLENRKHVFEELLGMPGNEGELFLGFSSANGQGGTDFSPLLMKRMSRLGLTLRLDLYPPTVVSAENLKDREVAERTVGAVAIQCTLEEFIETGKLGPIQVGLSQAEVESAVGPPPTWLGSPEGHLNSEYWEYGEVGLWFDDEKLQSISIQPFSGKTKGKWLHLDYSLLSECLTLSQLKQQLEFSDMAFEEKVHPRNEATFYLLAESGVRLWFTQGDEEPILLRISHSLED